MDISDEENRRTGDIGWQAVKISELKL